MQANSADTRAAYHTSRFCFHPQKNRGLDAPIRDGGKQVSPPTNLTYEELPQTSGPNQHHQYKSLNCQNNHLLELRIEEQPDFCYRTLGFGHQPGSVVHLEVGRSSDNKSVDSKQLDLDSIQPIVKNISSFQLFKLHF